MDGEPRYMKPGFEARGHVTFVDRTFAATSAEARDRVFRFRT
jgi:hypothetical protein